MLSFQMQTFSGSGILGPTEWGVNAPAVIAFHHASCRPSFTQEQPPHTQLSGSEGGQSNCHRSWMTLVHGACTLGMEEQLPKPHQPKELVVSVPAGRPKGLRVTCKEARREQRRRECPECLLVNLIGEAPALLRVGVSMARVDEAVFERLADVVG